MLTKKRCYLKRLIMVDFVLGILLRPHAWTCRIYDVRFLSSASLCPAHRIYVIRYDKHLFFTLLVQSVSWDESHVGSNSYAKKYISNFVTRKLKIVEWIHSGGGFLIYCKMPNCNLGGYSRKTIVDRSILNRSLDFGVVSAWWTVFGNYNMGANCVEPRIWETTIWQQQ